MVASALAVGWLLYFSAEAASRSSSAGLTSPSGARRLTASSPVVSVPVLSKMNALIFAASSMSATFLIRMPRRAAAESAATIAVGVARMNAQGQETTNTAMTRLKIVGERPDQRADDQHQRRVEAHVLIHDLHDRQLGLLGGENQFAHAAQRGVRAGAADFDLQHAGQVLRAGKNFVARLLVHRQRFAGDGGLVERALAVHDDAVRRDVVAGADADDVADGELAGGDFFLGFVGLDAAGLGGCEFDERFDGSARAFGGAGFDDFADQHEERDDAGGLVIAGRKGGEHGDGDELIDAEPAEPQIFDRGDDDRDSRG